MGQGTLNTNTDDNMAMESMIHKQTDSLPE